MSCRFYFSITLVLRGFDQVSFTTLGGGLIPNSLRLFFIYSKRQFGLGGTVKGCKNNSPIVAKSGDLAVNQAGHKEHLVEKCYPERPSFV